MKKKIFSNSKILGILVLSSILFALESAVLLITYLYDLSYIPFFVLHGVLALPLVFFGLSKSREDSSFPYLSLLFTVLGPFGALITLIFSLYYPLIVGKGKTFQEWYESLFPKEFYIEKSHLYESILAEREDYTSKEKLVPFMDIMRSGNDAEKSEAINRILTYFRPSFTQALVEGLKDKSSVIRVRAATAVARLEQEFEQKKEKLEHKLIANPKDEEALLALARSEDDYAHSAFVNEESRKLALDSSLDLYRRYLDLSPNESPITILLVNLLIEQGKYKEARQHIEKVVSKEGIETIDVLRAYLRILFHMGDYEKIRELSQRDYLFLDVLKEEEMRLQDIILLWRLSSEKEEILV